MSIRIDTEQTYGIKDRKTAGIIAFAAFALLFTLLCFIGYRISNPALPKQTATEEMTLIPLDAQVLEQIRKGSQAGNPAKANKAETTPAQMEQVLTAQQSSSHTKSGNSDITNTSTPTNNPSGVKHVSDNPFETGGINDGKHRGTDPQGMWDTQNDEFKSVEKIKRYLVAQPNTNSIQSDENCKIVLSVLVDPDGNIIGSPAFVKGSSTTNDMALINQVISTVKNQAQFNKVKLTKNTREAITIRITAN